MRGDRDGDLDVIAALLALGCVGLALNHSAVALVVSVGFAAIVTALISR